MRISWIYIFFFFSAIGLCQTDETWLEEIIENYVNQNPDGIYDMNQVEAQLRELYAHPVSIDKDKAEELEKLFFLSPVIRKNIELHLQQNGDLLSKYELQSIVGIDAPFARNLSRLIRLPNQEFRFQSKKFRMTLSSGIDQRFLRSKGYQTNKYLGSPHRFFFRSDFRIGKKLRIGLLTDKDPGEAYWHKSYLLRLPHISGFIELKGKKWIKNIILGDYKLLLGQGLLIYQGYGFGKTIDQIGNVRPTSGIRPNSSLSESFFLRGASGHFQWNKWHLIAFSSYKNLSATIHTDSSTFFKSIDLSGSLKTESEAEKQKGLKELLFGGSLQYRTRKLEIGLNYLSSFYNHPYQNNLKPYQIHLTSTSAMNHFSLDYKYFFRNGMLYGEQAFFLESKGFTSVNGLLFTISDKTSCLLKFRYFSKSYFSFYGSAISENTNNTNELGTYFNVEHKFNRKLSVNAYFDYFLFPWLKFNVDAPSSGFEFSSRLKYRWSRKMEVYLNYRIKTKEENVYSFNSTNSLMRIWKQQIRLHFSRKLDKEWFFSARIEGNLFKIEKWTPGFLFYLNLQYQPNPKWNFIYRFNLFSTENFDNAIYSLERSIGSINAFRVYSGEGIGSYLFIKFKPFRSFQVNFKCSFQHYFNQLTIGSGNEEIQGNFRGSIGLELKYSLR